ncbi:MAG: hypothetical protein KIT17_16000 [Rubrivivax sp.]|nr:hypothetical protein [Rubrivivax sp.]
MVVPPQGRAQEGGALPGLPAAMGQYALQDAQARLVQALATGDARQRVAARLLQQPDDLDPGRQAAWARGLLAEGLASRDAQAMRWASAACTFVADEAACRRRLSRARVQAEPANALHWLDWANDEPEAAAAAWAGLARASYWREHPLALAGLAVRGLGADLPAYLHATLAMEAMMRDAAFPAPPLTPVLERCGPRPDAAVAPAAGAGECERLARLLVEHSDSVQGLMLGRELGERLGWPADRLQRLDAEVQELQKQEHRWSVDERRPLGCATVEGQREHIVAVEREGELEALRRSAAATLQSPPASPSIAPPSPPPAGR